MSVSHVCQCENPMRFRRLGGSWCAGCGKPGPASWYEQRRATANRFALRPGEPVNKFAWLGIAPLIRAKKFPVCDGERWADHLDDHLFIATECARGEWSWQEWRRVLLPMLLEEAKRRGLAK